MTNVVRDKAWIEREYNQQKWPVVALEAERLIAAGETSIQRAIMQLEAGRRQRGRFPKDAEDRPFTTVSYGRTVEMPRYLAHEGYYLLQAKLVAMACNPQTAFVVELGSGLGLNLFRTWLNGGPADVPYFACELTEAGRRCTDILATMEPRMDCRSLAYDFMAPDYSGLPDGAPHAVVFSSQAIEQIPWLDPLAITGLLDRTDSISGVHFEPVGWQVPADRGGVERDGSYAEHHDYNRNFWSVLMELEAGGRIIIERIEVDFFGFVVENPVTLIVWKKV